MTAFKRLLSVVGAASVPGWGRVVAENRWIRVKSQRGAVSVEIVLLVPAVLLFVFALVAGWRIWAARSAVTAAAQSAARAASLESSRHAADVSASQRAQANLDSLGVACDPGTVSVDTADFSLPAGSRGDVRAVVTCRVSLSDLMVPGLPGHITVTGRASERLDTFRERKP